LRGTVIVPTPFVIGFALAVGGTVVMEEWHEGSASKPRIPIVCELMGIPWTNMVGLAGHYGAGFVEKPLISDSP
jgi:hypothetical protein